jgi:hydroxyacylglutathione hydrolase
MYFKQILNDTHGCASYVIASHEGEAAIVDPALDIEPYCALLEARGLTLRYVIDTHVHADHISGARQLVERHGAELCMYEQANVAYPITCLVDDQELSLGQLRLRVMHTPGHRSELISLLVINPPRSPEPSMVLTGDSLLVGDVGRPDFGGGDAAAQYESLSRLLRLPDWVAVFPGHFEGPCGKGMCGRPSTTIGFERLYNPLVRYSRAEFIAYLTNEVPPRPLNMTAVEATNRGAVDMRWAMLTTQPTLPEVDLLCEDAAGSLLIDVREPDEYAHGHIPGAINLPQADLATRLHELPRREPILVVCKAGYRSLRAARFLVQSGLTLVSSVKGGTDAWQAAGNPIVTAGLAAEPPRIKESEWAHGGGYNYADYAI